ncbi:Cation chloride cotransporter [Lasiodiplodia theobromae]|uniref:Cation chloride cotransporter n=1 Tax=Lasiodiplodia theobromae TaxID=45133 RepID=UPI0015C3FAA4|nr:Cation chloride cotransporter [Lasiodiplodia theobromae]KAF4538551.1 Cation chloride cotransporter [Lasiodiplodia theobromae]
MTTTSDAMTSGGGSSRMPPRLHSRSNFTTRAAQDDSHQLQRRWSLSQLSAQDESEPLLAAGARRGRPVSASRENSPFGSVSALFARGRAFVTSAPASRAASVAPPSGQRRRRRRSSGIDAPAKLGTFAGVFVPTTLNVLSILMFLRFGFILGQSGVLGMMGMLLACYAINFLTTLSISAIATNGTVRGGGAYYLISRSLGPEFGGSIGIVFYLGCVLNTGMNAVGLVTCFVQNFGSSRGSWGNWLPDDFWSQYLWATVVLAVCTVICLAGSSLFARCSNALLVILLVATFSIPVSTLFLPPFSNPKLGIEYTGLSLETLRGNLLPKLTKGAAGSELKGRETWQDLFGILFPATGGIFAGASMSGDLKAPSKSIPSGTLYGLALTFAAYTVVIISMAASITRVSLYNNENVIQAVNISGTLVLLGEFASTFFSTLMGVIGSAKLLQALARDKLIPGLSTFAQGTKGAHEPILAIGLTYVLSQLTMLADINQIASLVTMAYLMTFLVTNLACFLLKVASAPNFRPSFHFFNWWTAAIGAIASAVSMFFVDGLSATGCFATLVLIFLIIHYTTPPKAWGDVSQSLIYHQVRKYLLRLRQEHVKFWRPQILLFINDPRRQYKLIQFCNSLKKGALFILGHVIVTNDFAGAVPEVKRQQSAWTKYIDFSRIKAFISVVVSPNIEWGTRNVVLSAGLGGMKPNIVVMGFYNLNDLRTNPLVDVPPPGPEHQQSTTNGSPPCTGRPKGKWRTEEDKLKGQLPTDAIRKESAVTPQSYVTILEDLLLRLQVNVAIAKGFQDLELPAPRPSRLERVLHALNINNTNKGEGAKKYIDLWPIQMSAEIAAPNDGTQGVLTTNFDTYTLILQLGCILNTVPSWKRAYRLRVAVFVEYESDVEEERGRVKALLYNLRIEAEVLVFWLASGGLESYEIIVNGQSNESCRETRHEIEEALKEEAWWQDIQKLRQRQSGAMTPMEELAQIEGFLENASNWPSTAFRQGDRDAKPRRFADIRDMLFRRRRASVSSLKKMGVSMGMRTHRLPPELDGQDSSSSDGGFEVSDSGSDLSAASENDIDEFKNERSLSPIRRTRSEGESISWVDKSRHGDSSTTPSQPPRGTLLPPVRTAVANSDSTLITSQPPTNAAPTPQPDGNEAGPSNSRQSLPKFTSKPVPRTQVAIDDGPGPSIMFAEPLLPEEQRERRLGTSIYTRSSSPQVGAPLLPNLVRADESVSASTAMPDSPGATSSMSQASGFPLQQSVPLSFNDLPCRAQHLILNELIRRKSGGDQRTAVIFTTLPSPVEGTCEDEHTSVRYLADLEVLCQGLPPVMLVHSNSMTVTTNL